MHLGFSFQVVEVGHHKATPIEDGVAVDGEGRASGKLHLLAGVAVVALGYLHAPENALVLRAQVSKVSESESSHPAVV